MQYFLFGDSLISPGWPWTNCIAKDDLQVLAFLSPPPKFWDYKYVPQLIYTMLGVKHGTLDIVGRHPAKWANPQPKMYWF